MQQLIIKDYTILLKWLKNSNIKNLLLVCDSSIQYMDSLNQFLTEVTKSGIRIHKFQDFKPNPSYESVVNGVEYFRKNACDSLLAIGGGSALDVAKCIKAFTTMNGSGENGSFLNKNIYTNDIHFLAIPTTAGTGSEATRYAVIYYDGKKQSITDESLIPEAVFLNPDLLKTLPAYQRKATMMDALCHAIESFWSINSTEQSRDYSKNAIQFILAHIDGYLSNTIGGNAGMLFAAHLAGKAINITQTTAGHAMCYKITNLFGCAHGHAAILCDRILYPWMIENLSKCCDPRGQTYLGLILDEIGHALGCENAKAGAEKLESIFRSVNLEVPKATPEQLKELATSVNVVRLKNHPILLDEKTIEQLYRRIFAI